MASEKQIAANRRNARKSTGPKTAAGKKASSRNAVTHGALSAVVTVDDEERAFFEELLNRLDADLQPVGPVEEALVEKMAMSMLRARRLANAERAEIARQLRPSRINDEVVSHCLDVYLQESSESLAKSFTGTIPEISVKRPAQSEHLVVAEIARGRAYLLPGNTQNLIARYQTMLDAQFYKALETLKKLQRERHDMVDAEVIDDPREESEF